MSCLLFPLNSVNGSSFATAKTVPQAPYEGLGRYRHKIIVVIQGETCSESLIKALKNTKNSDEYPIPLTDFLNSFATGKILPNIKARYPGQSLIDFNEQFIVALAKLLYSFVLTKEMKNITER